MAPPVTMPPNPEGANGFQLPGFTSAPPTTRKIRMAPILISTMTLLASADSLDAAHQQHGEDEDDQERGNS